MVHGGCQTPALNLALPAKLFRQMGLPELAPARAALSNGRYTVMLNAAGSGYSSWREFAVTRWREDPVVDDWGGYLLLRDEANGSVWSAGP